MTMAKKRVPKKPAKKKSAAAKKPAPKRTAKRAAPPRRSKRPPPSAETLSAATAADAGLTAERLRAMLASAPALSRAEEREARYQLGLAYREMGLTGEAITELEKAAGYEKRRADSFAALGLCWRDKGDHEKALHSFKEALKTLGLTDAQRVLCWYEIAVSLGDVGDPKKAELAFRKAAELDPSFRDLAKRVPSARLLPKTAWKIRPRLREREAASAGAPFVVIAKTSDRDGIGGAPILRKGQDWPVCHCGERMVLFFQLDLKREYALPFAAGSHLLAFMCWKHNEANFPPPPGTKKLPEGYGGTFWKFFLNKPGPEAAGPEEPHLKPAYFEITNAEEVVADDCGLQGFKIGGVPSWAQDPENYRCSCGADMAFVCQVPTNFRFLCREGQPEQPGWYSSDDWSIFLGNETYVFACTAQCRPDAVWPINQN